MYIQATASVITIALMVWGCLSLLRPQRRRRPDAQQKHDIDEPIDYYPVEQSTVDKADVAAELLDTEDDDEPHWNSVQQMLATPVDRTILGFREVRSLGAQYLAAYVDNDAERMALIAATARPEQLLHGMTYVAHTHATVVAFYEDGDTRRVVQRDCSSAINRLAVSGE